MSKVDIVKKRYKYKSFHYNSSVYEVGESIQIQGYSEHPAFGKILQVQRDISTQEFILKIQWYYTHDDFPKWDFISKSEMFLTNEEQEIELLDIFRKIVVSPFEEFKWLDEAEDYEYCTRATYCPSTGGRFDPPTSQWEQTGCWLKILNPDHVHVIWENWQKWQHVEWIKESEDDFTICDQCKNEVHI